MKENVTAVTKKVAEEVAKDVQPICIDGKFLDFLKDISYSLVFILTFIACLLLVMLFVKGWQNNGN